MPDDSSDDELGAEEAEPELSDLLAANPFGMANFSKRRLRYMAAFDTERWADALAREELTFATVSAPLTWAEGLSVMHHYQEHVLGQRQKVTEADRAELQTLRQKIDSLLLKLSPRCPERAFFVRLGPRSPKDAPQTACQPWGVSEGAIRAALSGVVARDPSDANEVLEHFQDVCGALLRVTSAMDALHLLLSSARVMQDVSHTMDKGRAGWDVNLVARAWDGRVKLQREFRGFVADGRLTAVSQYDDQLRYGFVVQHAERIVAAILRCFGRVRPHLEAHGFRTAVVDFVLLPGAAGAWPEDPEEWQALVVEMNPFGTMTGASLFSWTGDRRRLQGGADCYGDLDAWEQRHPVAHTLPKHVEERDIQGVAFRFCQEHKPGMSWEKLGVFWEDYLRLARAALASPPQ